MTSRMYHESVTGSGRAYGDGGSWVSPYSPVQFGHQMNGDSNRPPATQQQKREPHEVTTFGVGIEFASGRRELIVSSLVPGCSAHANGAICVGDEMVEVDGVTGLDFKQAREIILGRQGTTVDLTFRRQSQTYRVTLMRGTSGFIQVSSAARQIDFICFIDLIGCETRSWTIFTSSCCDCILNFAVVCSWRKSTAPYCSKM